MLNAIYGYKKGQTQNYLSSGKRVPVTVIAIPESRISQVKTVTHDGYNAVQVVAGKGERLRGEIRIGEQGSEKVGDKLSSVRIFKGGDLVNVTSISKGKGFAGVVKRHGFAGGPKTHGQSDRHRAPGSIGQTTTPGRVFKGKRMAGRMGGEQVTQRNLTVLEVGENEILIKGTIPGPKNSVALISKVGEVKQFQPLLSSQGLDKQAIAEEQAQMEAQAETVEVSEEGSENGNT